MGSDSPQPGADTTQDLRIATEVALLATSAAAVWGMQPLFSDSSFRLPLLLQVALAHLAVAGFRRADVGLGLSGLATAVTGTVAIAWSQYAATLWTLLPSPETWTSVHNDISHSLEVFYDVRAPAPVEPGFLAAASIAIWVAAFLAD